jgi:flagellar basal-body rod protein FlgC
MNISSVSAPASAMKAATQRLDVTAHNVANVNTKGFKAQRAEQTDVVNGSAQTAARGDTYERGAGTRVYDAGRERQTPEDLNKQMTDMITEKNTYGANAKATKMRDMMEEETINLVA